MEPNSILQKDVTGSSIESASVKNDRVIVNFDSPRSKIHFIQNAFYTVYFENMVDQVINRKLTFKVCQSLDESDCPETQAIIRLPDNLAKMASIVLYPGNPEDELKWMHVIDLSNQVGENPTIAEHDIFDTYYLYVSVWVMLRDAECKARFMNEAYCTIFLEKTENRTQPVPITFKVSDRLEYADNKTKRDVIVGLPKIARDIRCIIFYDGDPSKLAHIIHINDFYELEENSISLEEYFSAIRKSAN